MRSLQRHDRAANLIDFFVLKGTIELIQLVLIFLSEKLLSLFTKGRSNQTLLSLHLNIDTYSVSDWLEFEKFVTKNKIVAGIFGID